MRILFDGVVGDYTLPILKEIITLEDDRVIRMIDKFNLSVDDVIQELNIKKEELLAYMKEKED